MVTVFPLLNTVAWVEGNVTNNTDPTGMLPEEGEIRNGNSRYTCRCGWIDQRHVEWGRQSAVELYNVLSQSIVGQASNLIPDVRLVYLRYVSWKFVIQSISEKLYYVPDAVLKSNSPYNLGLGMFMDTQMGFEEVQSRTNSGDPIGQVIGIRGSGFAEEDFPSDLLGYWLGMNGLSSSWQDIDQLCEVNGLQAGTDLTDSLDLFEQYGVSPVDDFALDWKRWERRDRPAGTTLRAPCGSEDWPSELRSLANSAVSVSIDRNLLPVHLGRIKQFLGTSALWQIPTQVAFLTPIDTSGHYVSLYGIEQTC